MIYACPGAAPRDEDPGLPPHEGVDEADFYVSKGRRDYLCKVCRRHVQRRYERKYERVHAKTRWMRQRRWSEVLIDGRPFTDDDFDDAWLEQESACKICRREFEKMPHVDHDHATHRFRGLLCQPCNNALGLLGDDVERLRSAIRYLIAAADM